MFGNLCYVLPPKIGALNCPIKETLYLIILSQNQPHPGSTALQHLGPTRHNNIAVILAVPNARSDSMNLNRPFLRGMEMKIHS